MGTPSSTPGATSRVGDRITRHHSDWIVSRVDTDPERAVRVTVMPSEVVRDDSWPTPYGYGPKRSRHEVSGQATRGHTCGPCCGAGTVDAAPVVRVFDFHPAALPGAIVTRRVLGDDAA